MSNIKTPISPWQCRLLSELALHERGGLTPSDLGAAAEMSMPCVYAQANKLAKAKLIRKAAVGEERSAVEYVITERGAKARSAFAAAVGLRV